MRALPLKRAVDVSIAIVGLTVFAVPILILLIAVALTSRGNPLFLQKRVGRNERAFTLYKLRSMRIGTANVPTHNANIAEITRLGHVLRRTKADELPQLFNVLIGDMSLVGPRPCLPTQSALIEARRRRQVFDIRPGITGLAQVHDIDMRHPEHLARVDALYLNAMSLPLDVRLILRTIWPPRRR